MKQNTITSLTQLTEYGAIVARGGRYDKSNTDISINVGKTCVTLTVRNGLIELIGKKDRVTFLKFPTGKALYFIPDVNGRKMNGAEKAPADTRYLNPNVGSELGNLLAPFKGDYELRFDDNTGFYYIKKED